MLLLLAGCPAERDKKPASGLAPCKEFGQQCEYSPGKLGSCVIRDNCTGNDCFECQSQH